MSDKFNNEENEFNIGAIYIFLRYIKIIIVYAAIGAVIGYFIAGSWIGALAGGVIAILIRTIIIRAIYALIQLLIDAGSK